mmetsp:Transcript_12838/g.15697  ORF Transcript_12838/g.15697 Transcript_12838/m.15697 type:complete len:118 (+) Transcript_12838:5-358(+)
MRIECCNKTTGWREWSENFLFQSVFKRLKIKNIIQNNKPSDYDHIIKIVGTCLPSTLLHFSLLSLVYVYQVHYLVLILHPGLESSSPQVKKYGGAVHTLQGTQLVVVTSMVLPKLVL